MRTFNKHTAGLLSASALAISLVAITQPAVAGISNTKHNLSTGSSATGVVNHTTVGTAEICVFCHTPHASNTSVVAAPLWNKKAGSNSSYTNYTSLNSASFDAVAQGPGDISLACLSCHDGTQAMDNIVNASGTGAYDSTGGGLSGLNYTWTGARVDSLGRMTNTSSRIAMLGTDLRNDHPIGMNYCAATSDTAAISAINTGICKDLDFKSAVGGNGAKAYLDTDANAAYSKTDLPLFNAGTTIGIRVECATCHDPHAETLSSAGLDFMRISNAGSAVCLSCHTK